VDLRGLMFRGKDKECRMWYFGEKAKDTLNLCFHLLQQSEVVGDLYSLNPFEVNRSSNEEEQNGNSKRARLE